MAALTEPLGLSPAARACVRVRVQTCEVCERMGVPFRHFANYTALEAHFNNDHHPCEVRIGTYTTLALAPSGEGAGTGRYALQAGRPE